MQQWCGHAATDLKQIKTSSANTNISRVAYSQNFMVKILNDECYHIKYRQ